MVMNFGYGKLADTDNNPGLSLFPKLTTEVLPYVTRYRRLWIGVAQNEGIRTK